MRKIKKHQKINVGKDVCIGELMIFNTEAEFENEVIEALKRKGWGDLPVIKYPTEEELIQNWANILYENNRAINRLGDYPLTDSEMNQILEQVIKLRTPLKLNEFINGTISITRDNQDDKLNCGKEISLKLYDRKEIAAGQSRYQIVQQPKFKTKSKVLNDRRGDLMLLINGMPLIHIELKKSNVSVSQAYNQIEKYAHEGIFQGIFSLIQIFVAMEPNETVYFANPGPDGKFNKDFYFHWADFNNEPINDWAEIVEKLLSIPMAHQLIGFYTVADDNDGILKVMRSYQFYAARAISDKVASEHDWNGKNKLGGYVWHTTGSGKTMTSFKSAQLIATSQDADKVVFLVDRIELGTQSLKAYQGFATDSQSVQATQNTSTLVSKLKSDDSANTLIVTSIQKMSNITNDAEGLKAKDLEKMKSKRIVFIVDECHRSTFGDMMSDIKNTFPNAMYFGFTGTPIMEENEKKMNKTSDIFGGELHRYSIADGIRDKNVLGFDPYMVTTFKDKDIRQAVALEKAKAETVEEALADPKKSEIFYKYMDASQVKMAGYLQDDGKYIKGIEDDLPVSQYHYETDHQKLVVRDIKDNWLVLSHNNKFHAIFATSSIPEAIDYYRIIKEEMPDLKVTCLFDPNISNEDGDYKEYKGLKVAIFKEQGLKEIIEDYNTRYDQKYSIPNHANFKKDIALRLAHKETYKFIEKEPEKQIDMLIVVDQMLTGFDSKWINTLYMDKLQRYENIIQTFSRTNRLFGADKPHGTIRYYRYPHTMKRNVDDAVKLYSGDKPFGLFVEKLEHNLNMLNNLYEEIATLFKNAGHPNFDKNPEDKSERGKFAKTFKIFNAYLEAAKVQGFNWKKSSYKFEHEDSADTTVNMLFNEKIYLILVMRYKELFSHNPGTPEEEVPFEIDGHITEIDTGLIDNDYMNSRFEKVKRDLEQPNISEEQLQANLDELHKSFAVLSQEEQKYANIFLHDVECGNVKVESGKTFRDYVTEYQVKAKNDQIHKVSEIFGLNEKQLRELIAVNPSESNINEYGRFDKLVDTVDTSLARKYFEEAENIKLKPFQVKIKADNLLREFILNDGFEL